MKTEGNVRFATRCAGDAMAAVAEMADGFWSALMKEARASSKRVMPKGFRMIAANGSFLRRVARKMLATVP
jgi:hypothetical protein